MKVKDLPENTNLRNIKIKTLKGTIGIWISQWSAGVWLHKEDDPNGRVTPIFDEGDPLEWEVLN